MSSRAIMSSHVLVPTQVEAGSAAEGGRCFLLDCTDFDADRAGLGNWQEWVPLIYPDANGTVPYVLIRLPLQPDRPPTPDAAWKKGDRVEVGDCCSSVESEVYCRHVLSHMRSIANDSAILFYGHG